MDNQKSQQGNGSNVGTEGSGSSMGKDMNKEIGGTEHVTSKTVGFGNLDHGIDKAAEKSQDKTAEKSQDKQPEQKMDKQAEQKIDKQLDKSATDIHNTIDKVVQGAQPMADRLASSAHASVDKVSSALTGAGATFEDKSKQLGEAYGRFAETGRGYVRTSPATSVLIALAAGYTLSKLFGRRN